jgi:signal transduction histidine kinase
MGAQAPAPTLPAQETNSRFLLVILQLLRLLPTAEQPLLLFLDDLQWADPASQHLLTILMTAQNIPNLLVIGSTREQPANPLLQQAPVVQLSLSALSATDVHHLLRDTLHRLTPEVERLAQTVTEKTGGNPFVITQFLQGLSSEGLLALEVQSGEWTWDMDAIRALQVHESQVDFILSHINRLPVHARLLLGAAACIGTKFALEPLHHAVGGELSELSASLQTLLEARLFEADDLQWRFAHDRIQQAAYDQVPQAERARLHLTLGRWLLEQTLERDTEEHLYQLVHHFQQADAQSLMPVECRAVARLQLAVAKRAKEALDFEQGLRACLHGISLLSENCWEEMYDTTFALHQERFELESLCGHRETAGELFAYLLKKAQTPLQALPIYQFRILTFYKENASSQAMKLGWEALRQFGLTKELRADRLSLPVAYLRIRRRLTSKRLQEWHALPPATDPQAIAQMEILWVMAVMMLLVDEKMMHRLILKILEISLNKGYAAPSGSASIVYGNLVAQRGEFELGAAYGQLGVETVTAYGKQTGVPNCQGLFNYTTNMMPFAAPMREVSRSFDTLLQQALEAGDLRVFANGLVMAVHAMLFSGQALEEVQQILQKHVPIMHLSQNVWLLQATQFLTGLVHNLRGLAKGVDDLSHPAFDEEEYRQNTLGSRTGTSQNVQPLNYWYSKFLLQFLAGKFDQALETAETLEQECTFPRGHFVEANFQALHALTLTQQMSNLPKQKQHDAWKKLLKLRKKLHTAAERCPANYLHKLRLLEAEFARLRGQRQRAMYLYDEAIAGALAHQFWNDEGIAQEFAAHFYRQLGKTTIADSYLRAARQAYLKWGALGKAQQMQVGDPHPFVAEESTLPRGNALDLRAVMQAAQAISSEIVLPELMAKMMRILLEHAGAQVGTLLFEADGRWVAHDPAVEVCQAVLNYVTRTRESVLLQDACHEGLFRQDASLQARQVKSLLCTPIRHQAKQVGLLYLENNAIANAFTAERLELLQLLSTQFAISLENAQLYENLEAKVRSRTNELEASKRQLERSAQETAKVWSEMAVLEERTRIAHELHDVIGHTLTTSIVQLESCKRIAVKKPDQVLGLVNNIQDNLRNGLQEVRVSVRMLKDNISQMELGQALEKLLHDAKTQLGLEVDYQIDPLPRLDANLRKTLYHALQEGLTNSVRHGKSTKVHFRLTLEHGSIHFELQDNGLGVQAEIPGFGLTTMRERVERLGGSLQILSAPSQGFNLRVQIPTP